MSNGDKQSSELNALRTRVRDLEMQLAHAREAEAALRTTLARGGQPDARAVAEQVAHAQKLESLGVLAGGVAHDFNNILVSVMGNAELLLLDCPPDSPMRGYLHEILNSSQRAAELCQKMLAYSGRGKVVVRPVDVSAVVREMTQLLDVSVSKRVQLQSQLADELPAIQADVKQVGQIVMNLLTNASEAIEGDGTILLRSGVGNYGAAELKFAEVGPPLAAGNYVFLEVADNGTGMDPNTRARMFDPFYTSKELGRGMGMAAVLGIVRSHGGGIRVVTTPGQGTTVTVLFPVAEATVAAETQTQSPAVIERGTGTIMVADDELSVRILAERALERAGYLVFMATNGEEAVEFFAESHGQIDLVLLDITMPKLNGLEVLERIRAINPEVRVVMMSGFDERKAVKGLERSPRLDFLQKPYKPTQLIERVQRMLRRT